ncbi:MAG: response regulator [Nitrospirae bacterium]|nr:response regulator [Nitrospirota bacterium]
MSEKILIIDNDPWMLMSLSILIRENTPYEVRATNNPLEAIELVRREKFDLVIIELKLPVMDGIEFMEAVKQIDEDIPVIIMAAYSSVESAIEAMQKKAFDYITKPFRKEQMLFTIDKALKLMKLKKENMTLKEEVNRLKVEKLQIENCMAVNI